MTRLETTDALLLDDAPNIEATIVTEGDEKAAETLHIHLQNALNTGFGAIVEEKPPAECSGFVSIDWDRRFELHREEEGGER